MATKVTLDSIREAAERKYGSYDIDLGEVTVKLLNPLRLSETKRGQLQALEVEEAEENESDIHERLAETVRIVAADSTHAQALLDAVDGDLALLATIIEEYGDVVQVGEASPSQN